MAKQGGVQGILFDPEEYEAPLWDYHRQRDASTKSFEKYAAQVRRRGIEVMNAFRSEYPNITLFIPVATSYIYHKEWPAMYGGPEFAGHTNDLQKLHYFCYGEHGLGVERRLAYEEAIRIPLVVRFPNSFPAGRIVDEFALCIDLAPTLLELAGVAAPSNVDGRSLVTLLRGAVPDHWRKSFLIEYYTDTVFPRIQNMGYRALRTDRYKYIHYKSLEGMDELYDLRDDPYEMKNLIGAAQTQETLTRLKIELARFGDAAH